MINKIKIESLQDTDTKLVYDTLKSYGDNVMGIKLDEEFYNLIKSGEKIIETRKHHELDKCLDKIILFIKKSTP